MLQPSLRLYITANIFVYGICAVCVFPAGLAIGIIVLLVSSLLSLSVVALLCTYFWLLNRVKPNIYICWLSLLMITGIGAYLPIWIFGLEDDKLFGSSGGIRLLSLTCAYLGLISQLPFFDRFFNTLSAKSLPYENN